MTRKASASLVIIMMGILLLTGILWFYGYHADATYAISRVEKIKRTEKEAVVNVAKQINYFSRVCLKLCESTYSNCESSDKVEIREICIKTMMQDKIMNIIKSNIN